MNEIVRVSMNETKVRLLKHLYGLIATVLNRIRLLPVMQIDENSAFDSVSDHVAFLKLRVVEVGSVD